jgi:hypothetical protein
MQWIALVGAVFGVWALLTIVGGERQRRFEYLRARAAADRAKAKERAEAPFLAK